MKLDIKLKKTFNRLIKIMSQAVPGVAVKPIYIVWIIVEYIYIRPMHIALIWVGSLVSSVL